MGNVLGSRRVFVNNGDEESAVVFAFAEAAALGARSALMEAYRLEEAAAAAAAAADPAAGDGAGGEARLQLRSWWAACCPSPTLRTPRRKERTMRSARWFAIYLQRTGEYLRRPT